ncbi:long-chain acyl-CoA synthetases & [Mariannaea sp. PMI_226]|nr:long-chain acyl-CoA synthetases & [Mariannaea sp. PMI_226]
MEYKSGIMPLYQVHKPPFTVEAPGYRKVPGETIPRRHPRAIGGLLDRPADDVHTVFDIVRRSARLFPTNQSVGWRKVVKIHKEMVKVPKNMDGEVQMVDKEYQFFELSKFSFLTYAEYEDLVLQLGSGLRKLGLTHQSKLHLFGATCAFWLSMAHSCASQSISIVTAYDTLGKSGLQHSLNQTECTAIYIDAHLLPMATDVIRKSHVKTVIVNDRSLFATGEFVEFKRLNPELTVVTFDELRQLGESNMVDPVPAKPSDIYCVMYTSGSTGPPKGVCITHKALVAGITGLFTCLEESVSPKEVILAYLPLAHILEMALENGVLFLGGTLGYGHPRTMADSMVKNCLGDMHELAPTAMVGVPQVWETVQKEIIHKVESSNWIVRSLFWGAFSYKNFMSRNGLPGADLFDGIVFSKVRDSAGGRVRFILNGASGIADATKNFLSLVLAPMLVGYGLTESCATGALGNPLEYSATSIGAIPAAIDVKLVSIPELGYSADAKVPQGEIWIKGTPLMQGYYDNPEETKKVLTPDGWLKSGDVGEFDADGHLRVIDRVKNLVKMQGGEYIALEQVEGVYRSAQIVSNVMVYADALHSRPIAVIMPREKALINIAEKLGVDQHDMHTDKSVCGNVLAELQATAKRAGLSSIETVANVVITDEEWSPLNGLVTATQKVNRRVIHERFKKEIEKALKNTI